MNFIFFIAKPKAIDIVVYVTRLTIILNTLARWFNKQPSPGIELLHLYNMESVGTIATVAQIENSECGKIK